MGVKAPLHAVPGVPPRRDIKTACRRPSAVPGTHSSPSPWSTSRVLITGGEGFLGSHLCAALLESGAEVVTFGHPAPEDGYFAAEGLGQRVQVISGDVSSTEDLASAFSSRGFDYVFHLAARSTVGGAAQAPSAALDANVRGTYLLLDHCRELHAGGTGPLKGVVVAGSARVYGQAPLPHTEDMPLAALSPYDASKVCADVLSRTYAASFGLPVTVARCVNVYGPGDANTSRIVPGTLRQVLTGQCPKILSDGTPERDYLYVADAVTGYLALAAEAAREGVRGEAFNLATGVATSVLAISRLICAACDRPDLEPEVLGEPRGTLDSDCASGEKARTTLGFEPQTPLPEGLRLTVQWYRHRQARP